MQFLLDIAKSILPEKVLKKIRPFGHGFLAYLGSVWYGFPSRKMVVIGVTGTSGKSTTTRILAKILSTAGRQTGYITTVSFFDGREAHINKHGMSMPGRFLLQRQLAQMFVNGCTHAIIECTSEGLQQNRHKGIDFDAALITNLSEAHLDAHGGFENYKLAKAKLFQALQRSSKNHKIIGVNFDDPHSGYYSGLQATEKFGVSLKGKIKVNPKGTEFEYNAINFVLHLPGEFNAYNAAMAIACAEKLGVTDREIIQQALDELGEIPGRMQAIPNTKGIQIFLDYAPEPMGMENALKTVAAMPHERLVHVFGSTGGHRDVQKRFEFGKISSSFADEIVITNDDVYQSDPDQIASDIEHGIIENQNRKENVKVVKILDRRQAINHVIQSATPGDIVIVTGKGSEQFLVLPGNQRIGWDEKEVIEEALKL